MKKHVFLLIVVALLSLSLYGKPSANQIVWYDSQLKAVGINPYWDDWGGYIDFDFNADHTYAGTIAQDTIYSDIGRATFFGLFYNTGDFSCSGWAETLGDNSRTRNYNSYVTETYCGDSPDKFRYFTDLWDPVNGETTIYVQPVDSSFNPIPIGDYFYYSTFNSTGYTDWIEVSLSKCR